MPDNIGYSEHLVAFIDLLGFREIARTTERRQDILALLKTLAASSGEFDAEREQITDPKQLLVQPERRFPNCVVTTAGLRVKYRPAVSAFSDNIVISFRINEFREGGFEPNLAMHFLRGLIGYVAWKALSVGFLIRGGVSVGELYHADGVVVGSGLIDAYELESRVANYPRVVLSKSIVENADFARPLELVYTDYDGLPCLDYMEGALLRSENGMINIDLKPWIEHLKGLASKQIAIFERDGDFRKLSKWVWFSRRLELAISRMPSEWVSGEAMKNFGAKSASM